jgi:CheY-like chemotaxis protein
LINDVLDLSKIEAGRFEIEETSTDLAKVAVDLRSVLGEAANRKGLMLTTSVSPDVPRTVVLDALRLRQVLLNLLGNAIKFTEAGRVRLEIRVTGERLMFEVTDTGAGIEPESITQIFAAFAQTKTGAAAGGTGLGLAICDRLISLMGGELKVDSVLGEGSRFWFTLPLVEGRSAVRKELDELHSALPSFDARLAPGQNVLAMVVDDNIANRHIMSSLLESAGVRVVTAAGGLDAIERAHADHPQIIFMDLKMNDLDGFEATRRLAGDPTTSSIPVVAVTASALGNSRQRARDAGCVDYLSKPVRAELLYGMLHAHAGVRFLTDRESPAPASADLGVVERRSEVGRQLRNAIALGDVGSIQQLAGALMQGSRAESALGERIHRLITTFDFDGLNALVDSLET